MLFNSYMFLFSLAWGGPMAIAIVAISAGKINYNGGISVFCGVDNSWSVWLVGIPLTAVYGTAVVLLLPIGLKLAKVCIILL